MDLRLFIIEISLLIVTCLSVIVAGVSAYLSYKARTSPYGEVLYSKQLEGYTEIIDALIKFYTDAHRFFTTKKYKEGKKSESHLRAQALDKLRDFERKHIRWSTFLPHKTNALLFDFTKEFRKVLNLDLPYKNDIMKKLRNAFKKIIRKTRKAIGTERLSEEMLKLITEISGEEKPK